MPDGEQSNEEPQASRRWFHKYVERLDEGSVVRARNTGLECRCPCCRCLTLDERGGFDVCPVCFWEDDGQDDADADVVHGGLNGILSLTQARANYGLFGASDQRFVGNVRKPTAEEI